MTANVKTIFVSYISLPGLLSAILALFCVSAALPVAAQSSSVSVGSNKSRKAKSEAEERRDAERLRKVRAAILASRKAPQDQKPIVTQAAFQGISDSLESIAEQKLPTVSKENDKTQKDAIAMEAIRQLKKEAGPSVAMGPVVDSFLQTEALAPSAAIAGTNFEGPGTGIAGFTVTGAPPDTTMAVGPNHIVAWVNTQLMVFNKSGTPLLPAPGFIPGNQIFLGLPATSQCRLTNRGDPLVQYDRLADRWILSQFAFNAANTLNSQCFAISTTNDPTGTYFLYDYSFGNILPDYGKLGIWNDGYYVGYNMFTTGTTFAGSRACAYDRTAMLAGGASTQVCFNSTARWTLIPADLDGPTLPTDTTRGGLFLDWNWVFTVAPPYTMRISRLKPDFITPASSTFTNGFGGAAFSFNSFALPATDIAACADASGSCVPQLGAGTALLDTLADRHMYRLAYRNRGGVDSLVFTQSLDPTGAGVAAVRWYEIRNPLGNPADTDTSKRPFVYQSSTFAPTTANRWMGSSAMNKYGDMMIGYSISSATTNPSIAVAGRSQCDTLNTLQAEQIAQAGTGSQNGGLTRWGDYSTMQVDPADDTTFWYTTQYLSATGSFNWRTRIVSYKFPTTTAITSGDFNTPGNWSNGVPSSSVTGIVPSGKTMTVSAPSTVCNLDVQSGGNVVMSSNLDITGALNLGNIVDTSASVIGLGCQATVSGASATSYLKGTVRKDFCATGGFTYPTGTANGYSPVTANVTTLTTNPSSLSIQAVQGNRTGMLSTNSLQRYWTLSSTGSLTTSLTFNYLDPTDISGTEATYQLYRWNGAASTAVTPFTLNTASNTISVTGVSAFSDWAAGGLAPTAAFVSVSGRVLTATGSGVRNALVILTDSNGVSKQTFSSSFGYYRFDDVASGQTYTASVVSKRYQFAPQVLTVSDDVVGVDFIGQ